MIAGNHILKGLGLKFIFSLLVLFYVAINNNTIDLLLDSSDRTEQMESSEESSENKEEKKETEDGNEDKLVNSLYSSFNVHLLNSQPFSEIHYIIKPFSSRVLSPPPEFIS